MIATPEKENWNVSRSVQRWAADHKLALKIRFFWVQSSFLYFNQFEFWAGCKKKCSDSFIEKCRVSRFPPSSYAVFVNQSTFGTSVSEW